MHRRTVHRSWRNARILACGLSFAAAMLAAVRLPAVVSNYQNLTIGPNGALVGGLGDVFNVHGNLINNSTLNTDWDTHLSQIGFNAPGAHQLAWTGAELGRGNVGYTNNFAVGSFVLPSGASLSTSGGGALYTRVLVLGDGVSQLNSITGSPLNLHYNPGSPQNAYLNFQTYVLPNGSTLSPAAAPADFNEVWNGSSGNWTDATRWSGGVVPLNTVSSVTLYDATINSGTVTLDQSIGYIQKLNLGSGATLSGPNSVTAWDMFAWGTIGNNSASTINDGAVVNANGDMSIVGDSLRTLDNATINNHAGYVATWAPGNSDIAFSNSAEFNNYGSFIVQNNRGLGHNGGTGTFNNYGSFTKNTGTGTTNIGSASFVFNNSGSISVQTGTLEFDTGLLGPAAGSVSVASGATLVFADGVSTASGSITNAGPLNVGDAIGAASTAVLRLQVNNQINNSSLLTVKSDGSLDINNLSESVGALAVSSGTISIGTGTLLPSSLAMTGGSITSTGSGKLQLSIGVTAVSDIGGNAASLAGQVDLGGANRTFTVSRGSGVADLVVNGNISNGGMTKTGAGIMTLSGNNTFGGGTQLQSGTLRINSPTAIGTGPLAISGGTTIDNTTNASIALTTNNTQSWLGSFTFTGTQSLSFGSGAVTLNSSPTVMVSANVLTVGPIGNGTGNSLTKTGAGTLYVSGGASYTGTTAVNVGTMTISGGPFASSASTVAAAATMNFVLGANAGSGTFANLSSATSAQAGGLIQFSDTNTSAGSGTYTNNGGTSTGNGARIVFNSGTTASQASFVNNGASVIGATGSQLLFNDGSNAGSANIMTHGGTIFVLNSAGALTLFSGNATAGAATLLTDTNSGNGFSPPLPGLTEFKDTSDSGTANITINAGNGSRTSNKWINSASAAKATITDNGGIVDFENNATAGSATITVAVNGLATFNSDGTMPVASAGSAMMTINAGGQAQFHVSASGGSSNIINMDARGGQGTAYTLFYDTSSAGTASITNRGGQEQDHIGGGRTEFHNSSSAGSGVVTNLGGAAALGAFGGETDFYDTSNAGLSTTAPATIVNGGGSGGTGPQGGVTQFFNASKAGTANIRNNSAVVSGGNNSGGYTYFNDNASADHANIINDGTGPSVAKSFDAGHTEFNSGTTADHATITNSAAGTSTGFGGVTDFNKGSSGGNAMITCNGATLSGAAGGTVQFYGTTAGSATIVAGGGMASGAKGGLISFNYFQGNADAGTASITANAGTTTGALGAVTQFGGSTSAASAQVVANGAAIAGAGAALTDCYSDGGSATFIANGGSASGASGATTLFEGGSFTSGSAALVANGGTNGGGGGLIKFVAGASAASARIVTNAGATFDSSFCNSLTVGSIEGAGRFQLGQAALACGGLNTDTTVSGLLVDGGINNNTVKASLVKQGSGKLTLTGANTYTGSTTIAGGMISTNLLPNSGVAGGIGQSSNAASNLVFNGGILQYTGGDGNTDRLFTLGVNGGGFDSSGTGPINLSNTGTIGFTGSGPRTFTFAGSNTGNNTIAQVLSDGTGGATSVMKTGSGTWLLNNINTYTGPTTITAGTLRYGGSDPTAPDPTTNFQAYMLSPARPAGRTYNGPLGLDFNVQGGGVITITQLGLYAAPNNTTPFQLSTSHTVTIYQRNDSSNTGTVLTSLNLSASAWNAGPLSADGYRFVSLPTPLRLTAGTYMVAADNFVTDKYFDAGSNGNAGTTSSASGTLAFVGRSPYSSVAGAYPTTNYGSIDAYGAGDFVYSVNSFAIGRIPGDLIINGPTAVLDLGNNQNGNVATVTLDGGGSIAGTGTSTLTSRSSFQMKSGTVTAILAGSGIPLVKTTAGTVNLSGANTYSGNDTVSAGTLKFNVTSGSPTVSSGVTATVAGGATLELAGTTSALGTAGGNRVHVVNNSVGASGAAAGLVISGTHQVVGGIDGSGSTQVNAGSDLTADHIVQSVLAIGGAQGSSSIVTIDASNATGSPLDQPDFQPARISAVLAAQGPDRTVVGSGSSGLFQMSPGDLSGSGIPADSLEQDRTPNVSPSAVPEPSTVVLSAFALAHVFAGICRRWRKANQRANAAAATAAVASKSWDRTAP
jgi:fibronectin-binding autotransporter adhesin